MKVKDILQIKGSDVSTVPRDRPIMDVVTQLTEQKIGAVVVVDNAGKVTGILSERDIVGAMARHGADIAKLTAADLMTAEVETCNLEQSIDVVMTKMTHGRFRHMPVIKDGSLAGLVSIGDAVKGRIQDLEHEREALKSYIAS